MSTQVQEEHVLVVPTRVFHEIGHFQGFSAEAGKYLPHLLAPGNISYQPRRLMETDPSFKQLIPYCLFRYTDATGEVRLLTYVRGKGQGEGRLHSKRSLGIGGHISADDAGTAGQHSGTSGERTGSPYDEGLRRELDEEVRIETPYRETCVGLINDDESEVGRVHLGVVHLLDVAAPAVYPREADILECGFVPLADLKRDTSSFETWSKICLESIL